MLVIHAICVLAGYKLSSAKAVQEVYRWRKVSHANVVALHEMFTTKVFGDNCKFPVCCVYCTYNFPLPKFRTLQYVIL